MSTGDPGAGGVSAHFRFGVGPSRSDCVVAASPVSVQPAGTTGASWTWSSASSTSSRSVAVTSTDCWPLGSHCRPDGTTCSVVVGVYDSGGSGPTAIRSRPTEPVPDTVIVLPPARSATATAVLVGTSAGPAGTVTGVRVPFTLTLSAPAPVWSNWSRYVPAAATATSR